MCAAHRGSVQVSCSSGLPALLCRLYNRAHLLPCDASLRWHVVIAPSFDDQVEMRCFCREHFYDMADEQVESVVVPFEAELCLP